MVKDIRYILAFVLLAAVQILLLNNIDLFGANAYIYILFVIAFPTSISQKLFLPVCFLLGLTIDIFSNTYAIHAAATTFIAYIRPFLIRAFISFDGLESLDYLSFKKLKTPFIKYMVCMVAIHHFLLFLIEAFSFQFIGILLLKTVISSAFTIILILCVQLLKSEKH